ncbi:MAG: hypothetical protein ACLQGP_02490 [Isosphaeraceae bacterium]
MLRRCPTTLIMLAAFLAIGLGSLPMSTRADSLTSASNTSNTTTESLEYTLTTTQAIPAASGSPPAPGSSNAPTPQLVAVVTPVSIVQPASISTSALQIFADSTKYYIGNPSQLSVEIANSPNDGSSITSQALGLSFYGQGLAANSSLTFSLPFSQSVVGTPPPAPSFTVYDPTTGDQISTISIKYDGLAPVTTTITPAGGTSTSTSTSTSGTVAATPEPLSLLVWSVLAGVGLWRVRSRRPYGPRWPIVGMSGK